MIGTKDATHTQKVFDFFHKHQYNIRGYYKQVKIILNTSQRFITLRMPLHRYNPIKFYIMNNFDKDIDLVFNPIPFKADLNSTARQIQLQAYHNDPAVILKLYNFLTNNDLSDNDPMIKQSVKHQKYQIKWNVPTNKTAKEIKHRWTAFNFSNTMNLHTVNRDSWNANMKNNAIIALNQMFKYRMSKFVTHNTDLRDRKKYLVHKTMTNHVTNSDFPTDNIPNILSKYPFLQLYAPSKEPALTTKIKCKNITIAFHNIDGSAKRKTHITHPYVQNLIFRHKVDMMALIDTRLTKRPSWVVPGYKLIAFKAPQNKKDGAKIIGGILVYAKYNLKNKIDIVNKTRAYDTIWLSLEVPNQQKRTYVAINYVRPRNKDNVARNEKFFNLLEDDINQFKNDSHNMFIMGDFNARMGAQSGDHNTNSHYKYMDKLIRKTGVMVANPQHATGYLTCVKNGGGSIVDLVLTDALNDIEKMTVDCSPIYNDHRPVVMSLRNTLCRVEYSDTHYMLSGFQPSDDKIEKHEAILVPRLRELKKFFTNVADCKNRSERQFVSNIITTCVFYTLHLATIVAFGVSDYNSMSKWIDSSLTSIKLHMKQNNIHNSSDQNLGKQLLQETKQHYENIKKNRIQRNTINFGNLSHCQKLKTYKNLYKKTQYTDDEPYLLYKNKYVNKDEALRDHYKLSMAR